ncbi:hypothetical protein HNR46_000090 [Haloferula luteola]|uniref:Uncharacterized protein n=1 Tax=Haloferula luteola TaxID=595692 RepID=A0A840V7Y0_9BACT|nr:hypothetical protein [Haloferula luteola]MBB5349869.1 hypothetical protein [Haloferula luteola]
MADSSPGALGKSSQGVRRQAHPFFTDRRKWRNHRCPLVTDAWATGSGDAVELLTGQLAFPFFGQDHLPLSKGGRR